MNFMKRCTAVILTLLFTISGVAVHAVDASTVTSATYSFTDAEDYNKGIDPEDSVMAEVYGAGARIVSEKFGRDAKDYSAESYNAAGGERSDIRIGVVGEGKSMPTLNLTGNVLHIRASLAYPSNQSFTKLSVMPYTLNDTNRDQAIEKFLEIDSSGALTFVGINTGITLDADRFYAFDAYINRSDKTCQLYVNGSQLAGSYTIGKGTAVGYPWGNNFFTNFKIDCMHGVIFRKTFDKADAIYSDSQQFYLDDAYIGSGDATIIDPAKSLADRILDPGKIAAFEGDSVFLDKTLKDAIAAGDRTTVTAAIDLESDETVKLVSRLTEDEADTLVLKNSNGTSYFYTLAERKTTLVSDNLSGSGLWSATVDGNPASGGFTSASAVGGKNASDASMTIDSGAEAGNVLDLGYGMRLSEHSEILDTDTVVVRAAILPQDTQTQRSLTLKAGTAGGDIITFEKDQTLKAAGTTIGQWKKGQWYNVAAVISLGQTAYELYVNGEKVEPNPQFDTAVTTANAEGLHVIQTGENAVASVTYVDDVEIYVGGYSPLKAVSKLSFTGYTPVDRTAERDNGVMTVDALKSAITCTNSYTIYDSAYQEITDGAVLPDEVFIVETAEDKTSLHTYRFETKFLLSEVKAEKSGDTLRVSIGKIKNHAVIRDTFTVAVIRLKDGKVEGVVSKTLAADAQDLTMTVDVSDGSDTIEVWAIDNWQNAASISQIYAMRIDG